MRWRGKGERREVDGDIERKDTMAERGRERVLGRRLCVG